MDCERGDRHPLREIGLGQAHPRAGVAHPLGKAVKGSAAVHGAHPTRGPRRLSIVFGEIENQTY